MIEQNPFDFLWKNQLYSGTYTMYEIAGETSYFIKTKRRSETIYLHKNSDGSIAWQTLNGTTDDWIQAVGEGIRRYISV